MWTRSQLIHRTCKNVDHSMHSRCPWKAVHMLISDNNRSIVKGVTNDTQTRIQYHSRSVVQCTCCCPERIPHIAIQFRNELKTARYEAVQTPARLKASFPPCPSLVSSLSLWFIFLLYNHETVRTLPLRSFEMARAYSSITTSIHAALAMTVIKQACLAR